jgi:hypothetical protein
VRLQRCTTNCGPVPELVRHLAGAKRGASLLVSARKLPSSSSRCSITRAREREWDIRRRQSVSPALGWSLRQR